MVKNKENLKKVLSDEIPIIAHIPINLDDLNSEDLETSINESTVEETCNNLFIKSEDNYNKEIKKLEEKLESLKTQKNNKEPIVSKSKYDKNTKCWWCKHSFETPAVFLPENYFKDKFIGFGHFCSYNCATSYNLDMNDEKIWKRNSLINLLYEKTYNKTIKIKPAPSWKILKDFGGNVDIKKYRKSLVLNDIEYTYLKPPIISQYSQIERKIKKSKVNKKSNELVLKRTKPLKSSKYTLQNTMGLRIGKNN